MYSINLPPSTTTWTLLHNFKISMLNLRRDSSFCVLLSGNELCMKAYKIMKGYTQRHATIKH